MYRRSHDNSPGAIWRRDLLIFSFNLSPPLPAVALLEVDSSSSDLIGCCHGDGKGESVAGGGGRVWGCEGGECEE